MFEDILFCEVSSANAFVPLTKDLIRLASLLPISLYNLVLKDMMYLSKWNPSFVGPMEMEGR